jgi:hypothetical protein
MVKGGKIGNSQEQLIKIPGANRRVFKHSDVWEDYGLEFETPNADLWICFDKDHVANKLVTELN